MGTRDSVGRPNGSALPRRHASLYSATLRAAVSGFVIPAFVVAGASEMIDGPADGCKLFLSSPTLSSVSEACAPENSVENRVAADVASRH